VVSVVEWPGYEGVEVVVNAQEFLGEGLQMVQMSRVGQNHTYQCCSGVYSKFRFALSLVENKCGLP
jgi:predicted pyridoxine 5'-phosphate oxidase superfamily flavin-nucleotide-binding protein